MMGRSHVLTGWIAGALTAHAIGMTLPAAAGFALVTAGASALNDLDHDEATASRVLGPASRALAEAVQFGSRRVYAATRGPGDPADRGGHRYATHALPMMPPLALLVFTLPWLATGSAWLAHRVGVVGPGVIDWAGPAVILALLAFCVIIAADRIGSWLIAVAVAGAVIAVAGVDVREALVDVWVWVVAAVLLGCVVHIFGDLITEQGVPLLAPLWRTGHGPDQQRWARISLPKLLAFRAGGWFETNLVLPALVVGSVLATPGVWPLIQHVGRAVTAA